MELKNPSLSRFYFDHATYTPYFHSVKNCLIEKLDEPFIENRPLYASDAQLEKELLSAYKTLRSFFSSKEKDAILFASSYHEAIKTVYATHLEKIIKETGKNHIFYLAFERQEMLIALKDLEKQGCIIEEIPLLPSGLLDIEELKNKINPKTSLITLSWAHPQTGVIQPLEELYDLVIKEQIHLHLDATSVLGKIFFRFEDTACHYLTMNPVEMGGPYPLGVIVMKYQHQLKDLHNKIFTDSNSKSFAKLFAFTHLCYEIMQMTDEFFFEMPLVKEAFEKGITQKIKGAKILFSTKERLQSHSVIYFPNVHQEMMLYFLSQKNIFASIGFSSDFSLFNTLLKMGVDPIEAKSALSFSFSCKTLEADVLEAIEEIAKTYQDLMKFSAAKVR